VDDLVHTNYAVCVRELLGSDDFINDRTGRGVPSRKSEDPPVLHVLDRCFIQQVGKTVLNRGSYSDRGIAASAHYHPFDISRKADAELVVLEVGT